MNYQNQNLFQPYSYNQNPYPINPNYQTQNQYQGFQPVQQAQTFNNQLINGKIITKLEDITANDVPMDGSEAIFPLADKSKIYIKQWNANGTISTVEYLPQISNETSNANNSTLCIEKEEFDSFKQLLTSIEEKVNKLSSPRSRKKESETLDD